VASSHYLSLTLSFKYLNLFFKNIRFLKYSVCLFRTVENIFSKSRESHLPLPALNYIVLAITMYVTMLVEL